MRAMKRTPRAAFAALLVVAASFIPGVTLAQARAEISTMFPAVQAATIPPGLAPREQNDMRSERVQVDGVPVSRDENRCQFPATPGHSLNRLWGSR